MMGTKDEITTNYFKGSNVQVAKVSRCKGGKSGIQSLISDQYYQAIYTHHQKIIICDLPAQSENGESGIKLWKDVAMSSMSGSKLAR